MRFRDMNDLRDLIGQMSIGSMCETLSKVPGLDPMDMDMPWVIDLHKDCNRMLGMIDSMTSAERRNPALLDGPRRRRIAAGCGVEHADVCRLLDLFDAIAASLEKLAQAKLSERFRTSTGLDELEFLN